MNEYVYVVIVLIISFAVSIPFYFYKKRKVLDYVTGKYHNYNVISINWTLFGPWAPGRRNTKFRVVLERKDGGETKEIYAISSFFGAVYIND